jgi:hypothetical protein
MKGDELANCIKRCRYEQNAGPSTLPLAIKPREAPLRMTLLIEINYLPPFYMSNCK